jgi:hypothetical protein
VRIALIFMSRTSDELSYPRDEESDFSEQILYCTVHAVEKFAGRGSCGSFIAVRHQPHAARGSKRLAHAAGRGLQLPVPYELEPRVCGRLLRGCALCVVSVSADV